MLPFSGTKGLNRILKALDKSQATIEFKMDGTIITANKNFLNTVGYTLQEIKGKHHSMFVDPVYAKGKDYADFWKKLNRGEFLVNEYKRYGKGGKEVWIQASYNPIKNIFGKPYKVVKYASFAGQIDAVNKSQAVIEFNMDGTILFANTNFLNAMGYTLAEVQGRHHSMFAEPAYASSPAYKAFWEKLNRGEFDTGEYKRIGKGGKEVWIRASYNPIAGVDGKPFKVVKYAIDVTEEKLRNADYSGQIEAIGKSQAVISFHMDGTIIDANENFLKTMGYTLAEIQGKHHSMFAESAYASSPAYKTFWTKLNRGEFDAGEYKRIGKGGKEVWIQASYNPIVDTDGKPFKVVKYATDITKEKLKSADFSGQIEAIGKSQAVISFHMDGTIIDANENFLKTMGYTLAEVQGRHHRMFAEPAYASSPDYKAFWEKLNRGEYQASEYKRIGKGGKEVWIQASYNPIVDADGKPFKVVKYATDITKMVTTRIENEKGITEAVDVLKDVASGVLTNKMEYEYTGDFSDIKTALNATIEQLKNTIASIREMSSSVNAASEDISSGSRDLSARTEQQASSLEETAASMEEMTGAVRQNTDNASNANKLSAKAKEVANKGGRIVGDVVNAMSEIKESSNKIADIIGVIDEIAFQTNLLALNAAVEAARAGDAGKGFAVVASEVRSLAGRSAAASKDIKALISTSVDQVAKGSTLVNDAGEKLTEIESAVDEVAQLISGISAASTEQSSGINEISQAISQMDEMTQQNAALVEENTAAAQSLVDMANKLGNMVKQFRLELSEEELGAENQNVKEMGSKRSGNQPHLNKKRA